MKAIILAAGEGKRLRPLTNQTPKCLVKILNKSILERQISLFKDQKIDEIYVVGGYLSSRLENNPDYELIKNDRYKNTNMVYSLMCAKNKIFDDVIISYGDILYSEELLKKIINSNKKISIAIDINWKNYWEKRFLNPLDDLESLKINDKNEILEIGSKVYSYKGIDGQYMGLIKLNKNGSDKIISSYNSGLKKGKINNKDINNSYMTDIIKDIINSGYKVNAIKNNSPWVEIDTLDDFENKVTIERIKILDQKLQ